MRKFLAALIFIFSQESFTKADDISDFQIDGMTPGESLLKHFNKSDIKEALRNATFYPKSKKMKVILLYPNKESNYDEYDFHILNNDPKFIIQSVKGRLKMSIKECLDKKKVVVNQIENILPKAKKENYINDYNNAYGKSRAHLTDFVYIEVSVRVWCADWDSDNKTVINNKWTDELNVGINPKNFLYFINNEAYK